MAAGVLEDHRVVGRHLAERVVDGEALDVGLRHRGPLLLVPAASANPFARLGRGGGVGDELHDLVPTRDVHQVDDHARLAQAHEVAMPLDEAGHGGETAQVHDLGGGADVGLHVGGGAQRHDTVAANGQGLDLGRGRIHGHDLAAAQHHRCRLHRRRGAPAPGPGRHHHHRRHHPPCCATCHSRSPVQRARSAGLRNSGLPSRNCQPTLRSPAMPFLIEALRQRLAAPLPGLAAQLRMAPLPRPGWDPNVVPAGLRHAAGLVFVYPRDGEWCVALTLRGSWMRQHTGQVSLPGGRVDQGESVEQAALREAHEEIGVTADQVEIVGQLTSLHIPVSGHLLHPVVGCGRGPPGVSRGGGRSGTTDRSAAAPAVLSRRGAAGAAAARTRAAGDDGRALLPGGRGQGVGSHGDDPGGVRWPCSTASTCRTATRPCPDMPTAGCEVFELSRPAISAADLHPPRLEVSWSQGLSSRGYPATPLGYTAGRLAGTGYSDPPNTC